MTLITFDGFENYSALAHFNQVWTTHPAGSPAFPATGGYNNTRGIQMSAYGTGNGPSVWYIERSFPASRTVTAGIAMKFTPNVNIGYSNIHPVIEFKNGANSNICVYIRNLATANNLVPKYYPSFTKTYNFPPGATIATGNVLKNYDITAWHYYELELDCSTNGFARFYIDGNKVLELNNYNFSSDTTAIQSSNIFRSYAAIWTQSQSSATDTFFDNFYLTDNTTRLGHLTYNTLRPTADTDQRDWIPSTGTVNYDLVNDPGSQTTNNVSATINDATDYYVMSDLTPSTSVSNVLAVKHNIMGTKSRFGETSVSGLMKYGNNTINTPFYSLTENTYNTYLNVIDTNPVTNQNWLPADLNNMQIGMTSHLQSNIILKSADNSFVTTVANTALVTSDTGPTLTNGAAIFGSGNVVRYSDAPGWHITSPWSVEFDFYTSSQNVDQCIFNIGGSATTYPEFNIMINSDNSVTSSVNSNNTAGGQQTGTYFTAGQLQMNKWYRIGAMVYTVGSVNRLRGYINGYQKFDIAITLPYDATKGVSIGNDYDALPAKQFLGGIKNFSVSNSLYWIAYTPVYNNIVFAVSNGLVTNSSGSTLVAGNTPPVTSGNELTFTGTQRLRYTDGASFRAIAPYSVEFDFKAPTAAAVRVIMTIGQSGVMQPELQFEIGSTNIMRALMYSSSSDAGTRQSLDMINPIVSNQWYKIGFMLYDSGGLRARCYVDGVQVIDQAVVQPWNSTAGFCIGSDNNSASGFTGSIRRLSIGQALFWNI